MSKPRRIGLFVALFVLGAVATVAQLLGGDVPKSLDPAAWTAWLQADLLKSGTLVFSSVATGIGFIGTLIGLLASAPVAKKDLKVAREPIAMRADLQGLEARFMAKLASARVPDAPPSDADVVAAQAKAVSNILISTNPLDAKAYEAMAREDVDGAIAAMLEAADADRDQAARRYREAGALSYGRNVVQAIAAYEQADRLDPGDCWTNIFLARLMLVAGRTAEAAEHARKAVAATHDARERMVALDTRVDALLRLGKLDDAFARHSEALAIAHTLVLADPGNVLTRRDLSVSLERSGDILRTRGDLNGALAAYSEGLVIRQSLAEAAGARRDLSVIQDRIGDIKNTQGDLDGALASYRAALDIARKLAAADPGNREALRDLSVSLNKAGDVLAARGDLDTALASYQEGLDIRRTFAAADPGDTQAQKDVATSLNRVGDALRAKDDTDGAFAYFSEGLAIARKLSEAGTGNAEARRDLCVSLMKIGDVLATREDIDGAHTAYREGYDNARLLAEADPGNVKAQLDLGLFLARLAVIYEVRGDATEACRLFQEAHTQFEWVSQAAPDWEDARHMAEVSAQHVARLCTSSSTPA